MSLAREHLKILQATKEVKIAIAQSVEIMGVEALNHFTKSFRNQGFEDVNIERWQPRKGEISGGIARVRKRDAGSRAILVKSGALRRSLFKYRSGVSQVTIKSQLPYAIVHNEGLKAGRSGFKMPKRQFVGNSSKLVEKLYKRIDRKILNVWK
jgi:phage gpG-like protein